MFYLSIKFTVLVTYSSLIMSLVLYLYATCITLILTEVGAVEIKDFLPVSLVSGMYKIITKVTQHK
jgi:hypothetical protein